jgi:hypothetical protein
MDSKDTPSTPSPFADIPI